MKQRKPRTKKQNTFFESNKCWYFDGIDQYGRVVSECNKPWAYRCDGNPHNCKHLKMEFLASLSAMDRKKYLDKNG